MKNVKIYTIENCASCKQAKSLLTARNIPFEEIPVKQGSSELTELVRASSWKTFPQIFVGESFLGGYSELEALDKKGELNRVLEEERKTRHCCCG